MNKLIFLSLFLLLFFTNCHTGIKTDQLSASFPEDRKVLDLEQANQLAELPLACISTRYPYKPGNVLSSADDLVEPFEKHPAFYGCFDWHSAVHGHWSLVKLLKEFPLLERRVEIRKVLRTSLSAENILREVAFFEQEHNYAFERTYGWAWLFKLAEELGSWDEPLATELSQNLQPLIHLFTERLKEFLPKLVYPIRVGEHSNTAFALVFAWDYAQHVGDTALLESIRNRSIDFYSNDRECPVQWEPSGFDFLSPCLEEIDLMRRLLDEEAFMDWLSGFAPGLLSGKLEIEPGQILDRNDGKLVHLDGLNFSRAWVLYGLSGQYPDPFNSLISLANDHMNYSLPNLVGDSYEGGHWLASFAIYALFSGAETQ